MIKKYKLFLESKEEDYSIYDWANDLISLRTKSSDYSDLEKWTEHFIGSGYWNKIKSYVDSMFTTFSDINMKHIKDALLEVFDEIPEEKEKLIYCAVIYGDYERYSLDDNSIKYNGTMPVIELTESKKRFIIVSILLEIVNPTLKIGRSYSTIRKTNDQIFVTDEKWQCKNFDIRLYQNNIDDYDKVWSGDINKINKYSVDNIINMYRASVIIAIGGLGSNHNTGKMDLLKLENDLDQVIDLVTADLDYEDIIWDMSRGTRRFDTSNPIIEYTVKILLKQ